MYRIQSGIPIPPIKKSSLSLSGVLRKMKKGDSVKVNKPAKVVTAVAHNTLGSGHYAVRRNGTGVRVWRIK